MPRILVADDSKLQRAFVRFSLDDIGYEVLEAANGESALEVTRNQSPDCILLDLYMPDISGRDVLQTLRSEGIDTPIIIVTADVEDQTRQQCLKLGANLVINKPKDPQDLVDAIAEVLGSERT